MTPDAEGPVVLPSDDGVYLTHSRTDTLRIADHRALAVLLELLRTASAVTIAVALIVIAAALT